ncbi:MAG: tetratricopeptide repeat protein [Pseudomonadota bacterium]
MREDRYGNPISTSSAEAQTAYNTAVDLFLGANAGTCTHLDDALAADPDFALAHLLKARAHQMLGQSADANAALAAANAAAERRSLSDREHSHFDTYRALLSGRGAEARQRIVQHAERFPRDALAVQPATGVFGLIGFSGCDGREAEQLSFVRSLERHYADDWWFLGQVAFAEAETGAIARSERTIERSLSGNPRNANAAHIKAHIHYEQGEASAGLAYLNEWSSDYDRSAPLYCHVNWHRAIWALEQGDTDLAWSTYEGDVMPGCSPSPPINVATDSASFLFRAELAGGVRRPELWAKVADYVSRMFPTPGVQFLDFHAALIYAMAGDGARLNQVTGEQKGPARDVVRLCGSAFQSFASGAYDEAAAELIPVLSCHETLGGSRAQRDLLEFAYAAALLRAGKADEAGRALVSRRPSIVTDPKQPLQGRVGLAA